MDYPLPDYYQMFYAFHNDFALWLLIFAILFGGILSFAVGANDSANSWGTPVGAGTVTLGTAFVLGSIMETLGSMLLSGEVVKTVAGAGSVINIDLYRSNNETEWNHFMQHEDYMVKERTLMLGLLSSMIASQIWQLLATYLAWPVSGTHAIISALFGFTVVENGWAGVNPGKPSPFCGSGIFKVLYGLAISPFISLFISFGLYYAVYKYAVKNGKPTGRLNRLCYSFCVFLMFMAIGFTMATAKGWSDEIPTILTSSSCLHPNKNLFGFLVGIASGLFFSVSFHFFILPLLLESKHDVQFNLSACSKSKNWESNEKNDVELKMVGGISKDIKNDVNDFLAPEESQPIKNVFRPLQLIVACFAALNHGGNDVGNCIGPLVTIWFMYKNPIDYNLNQPFYEWTFWGGLCISLGLVMFGRKVIMTMGTKITPMTPSLGFVVVLSASLVVMFCSFFGIPTSTTHCQVLAVVGAGIARGTLDHGSFRGGLLMVDFRVFKNIGLSWICTLPFSAVISMALYAAIRCMVVGEFGAS